MPRGKTKSEHYVNNKEFLKEACTKFYFSIFGIGEVVTWVGNDRGQRNDSPTDIGYIAIACGKYHTESKGLKSLLFQSLRSLELICSRNIQACLEN